MIENVEQLHSLVCIEEGVVTCFCKLSDWKSKQYKCRVIYNCPEALLDVKVLPFTRPSDEIKASVNTAIKSITKSTAAFGAAPNKIKQGIVGLEKAIEKLKFRI